MPICHEIKNNWVNLAQGNDNKGDHAVIKQLKLTAFAKRQDRAFDGIPY